MKRCLLFLLAITTSSFLFSQAFVPGNLVVSRYGDSIANLPTTQKTVPVFLDEYDLSGHRIQTLAMPTSGSSGDDGDGSNNRVLTGGTKFKEGLITLSPNGYFLTMIGYNTAPYGSLYSITTQRTIGVVTPDGVINTSTGVRAGIGNPRCAITNNGANVWSVGSGSGLRRKTVGAGAQNDSVILFNPKGYNSVYIFNGQLYYTTDDAASPKIAKLGSGLPYSELSAVGTGLPGYPNTGSPNQIIMLDQNTDTPDPDLMYVTDIDAGSLQKWVFEGTQWVSKGAVTIPGITDEIRAITGNISDGNVVLYAVTSQKLLKFSDTGAISSTLNNTNNVPVVLAQAPGKTLFRGVAYTPGTVKKQPFADVNPRQFASLIQNAGLIRELKTNVTYQRYPGVEETNITYTSNKGVPIALFFLKVNLANPNVVIEAGTPFDKPAYKLQSVRNMIPYKNTANSERQVIAATNGDYFSWTGEPDGVVHKNGFVIKPSPDDKFFFSIRNDGTALIGDKRIYNATSSSLKEAIGGRFYLMHYGETMTEHLKDVSVEPRTTVGVLSPERVVFMWVDGRRAGHSAGLSLTDMAKIYKAIGATDAINMDGGGSSTFIMRQKNGTYETRNKPSDNTERAVGNSLMVMLKSEIFKPMSVNPNTGIMEKEITGITVYPNPVKNHVIISVSTGLGNQNLAFKLFDAEGKTLLMQNGSISSINAYLNKYVEGLNAGVYFITITGADKTYTAKFIKE